MEKYFNNFKIGASFTAFILSIIFRLSFTYLITDPLPFSMGIVDAIIVAAGATLFVLSAYEFIHIRFPDTAEMLPLFAAIVWTVIVSSYIILRYQPNYQSSLSILVTAVFVGMGWWIQAISTAANARRTHTLNIIMASRTSSEYQEQTRKSAKHYRANVVPPELAEWRFSPNKEEFRYIDVPDDLNDSINGSVYVLNYFEFLAQGIKCRDLDEKLLKECFSGILKGVERRCFYIIIEAQKGDPACFEGIIFLSKRWNNESIVERYRSNPDGAALGPFYPASEALQKILQAKKRGDCEDNDNPEHS
ncbi:DUF4760 domain-containing protein [Pseudomonas sp. AOB-7]|uniref:DUF4760 domain-containing protein n=1 Tax=Pseudomonas sp. AOB-7 TaxID=2482750 RepID=UPI000EFC9720|nr:DUF4760 domain-containing protein [Pseudomonas sp. AOB-7]RMH85243.1 DUF4760 domain-containing protein [Pseudomonas sp. AOB-7]